jgi:RNA polymerase sigma-70 factor (ECF subfamily)
VSAARPAATRSARVSVLERVYADNHDAVWRCLRALGVRYDQLDDATQDVFIVVHRRLPSFDHAAPVRAWILGIARNVARKYRGARPSTPLLSVIDRDDAPSPEQIVQRREAAELVQRVLDSLPLEQREVLVLIDLHGLSAPDVAAQIGAPLNTVYSRLRLARARLDRAIARTRVSHGRQR